MIVLGLFLRPQLAFWVVVGIPVSFAGGIVVMHFFGISANMMSLFGFIIVVGVVVDDAIVTGESVYTRLQRGADPLEAAIEGTRAVTVPVTFGILTTIVAFLPLLFFEGMTGDFARQIPFVVAPVLLFSLVESKLILPAHLKNLSTGKPKPHRLNPLTRIQRKFADGLEWFVQKVYQPVLRLASTYRYVTLCLFIGVSAVVYSYTKFGHQKAIFFPQSSQPCSAVTLIISLEFMIQLLPPVPNRG